MSVTRMTRFYIHIADERGVLTDDEGFVAADLDAARRMGGRAAGEMVAHAFASGDLAATFELRLHGEDGERVATLAVNASIRELPADES